MNFETTSGYSRTDWLPYTTTSTATSWTRPLTQNKRKVVKPDPEDPYLMKEEWVDDGRQWLIGSVTPYGTSTAVSFTPKTAGSATITWTVDSGTEDDEDDLDMMEEEDEDDD